MRKRDLLTVPAPFLSRFEKYALSVNDFLDVKSQGLSDLSSEKLQYVIDRTRAFVQHVNETSGLSNAFLGYGDSTLASLLMSHMQSHNHRLQFCPWSSWTVDSEQKVAQAAASQVQQADSQRMHVITQALCIRLLQLLPPEVATLQIKDGLGFAAPLYRSAYFHTQEHFDFQKLLEKLMAQNSSSTGSSANCIEACDKTVVMTRSSADVTRFALADGCEASLEGDIPAPVVSALSVVRLELYKSSRTFEDRINAFILDPVKRMVVVVADATRTSAHHLNYVRHIIDELDRSNSERVGAFGMQSEPERERDELEPEPEDSSYAFEPEPENDHGLAQRTSGKTFVLLLHFAPEDILMGQGYPAVFLLGWDYMYIDSTAAREAFSAKALTSLLADFPGQQPLPTDEGASR